MAVFGSIQQGVHRVEQCAVCQHNFHRYSRSALSIYDLFKFGFSLCFLAGRDGHNKACWAPGFTFLALPIGIRQDRECRRTLPSPWVGVAIWGSQCVGGGMNRREESRNFRAIETDCKMHDGEGEAHYESFIFGSEAADAEMSLWKDIFYKVTVAHTPTLWSLAPTCSFYGPDHNLNIPRSIFYIKREKTETLKGHEIREKEKASYQGQGRELDCVMRMWTGNHFISQEKVPHSQIQWIFFLSCLYLAAINVHWFHWFKHVLSQWPNPRYRILPLWESN